MNVPRAAQGSLENSPFSSPPPHSSHFSSKKQHGVFWATVRARGGALLDEKGERVREMSLGKVKGALCRLDAWYRSNLSSSSSSSGNAAALSLYETGTIWPPRENRSWLGTVGVQLSRWNTLSPSGRTIPSAALTRKEFLYHSSHNKEERERSRAGGRRSEVSGGQGRGALWGERRTLFACDCGQRKSMSYQGMCECVQKVRLYAGMGEWVDVIECASEGACVRASRLQFGMLELGGRSKDAQTKLDFSPPPLLFFFFFEWWLRTGWIPLLMLFGSTVLQGKFGSRKLQTAKTATSSGLAQGESLVLDFAGQSLREPCVSEWVVTGGFAWLKWKTQVQQALRYPTSVNGSFWCEYIWFLPFKQLNSLLGFHERINKIVRIVTNLGRHGLFKSTINLAAASLTFNSFQ